MSGLSKHKDKAFTSILILNGRRFCTRMPDRKRGLHGQMPFSFYLPCGGYLYSDSQIVELFISVDYVTDREASCIFNWGDGNMTSS
jgi:hypothetical protein